MLSSRLPLLSCLLLLSTLTVFSVPGQANDPFKTANADLTGNSTLSGKVDLLENSSPSVTTPDNNLLTSDPGKVSFLPVTEAYQLSASIVDGSLLANAPADKMLSLHWDIAPRYYLYQHQLKVVIDGDSLPLELPEGIEKYDDYFEKELTVYYSSLDLLIPLPENADPIRQLTVHSQGCADAGLCYPPLQQQVQIQNNIAKVLTAPGPNNSLTGISTGSSSAASTGFWLALFGALAGGILLNLMPCVFPVLSLKALSLARSQENPHQQHLHGWAYTLGVIATFVAIATIMLLLRQAGQAIGWGFQLQSPLVVALLAYLFFIMGLGLSGFIQLGGKLSGSGQSLTEGHSYRASFFTGALASVVASPCTAPFMGGALGFAVTQPAPLALTVFAALGFGMALPFLLLTYFPSLSRRLPKPGQWMETLKQLLAFPLFLTALWLLWVVGRQTGSDAVVALSAGALGLSFAAWLWQHQPSRISQKMLAVVVLLASLLPLNNLNPQDSPANGSSEAALANQWQPYSQKRLDQLLANGTPTFVNLTADWCITCLANEKVALDTETSINAFEQAGIVKLKGDWTHYNPEITHLLSQFGRNGVPLYLLYSGRENDPPVILPQILRERTITNAIKSLKISN
ncbi:protein-disulfide reductase DsbD [Aestuariicella sp. G3-2]|uniref:protein-disulfide reductase DsbD family protein n=1 Tax=Pseudomaricurvus albidus TaxID=2842452 RepID=UPI001C0C104B|nr:protein-disulfide reductase DsbD [Aestuariicella albida]MBU3069449.1 protein-disulfide reductase DsbD [Aestuariicella albida]